jgi:two-component system LytT family sensor kinase
VSRHRGSRQQRVAGGPPAVPTAMTTESGHSPLRLPAVVFGVWTALGLLESSKAYVADQLQGIHRGWGPALVGNLPWWWCWALLTPVVFGLAARVSPRNGRWLGAAVGQGLLAGLVSTVHLSVVGTIYWYTITRPALPYLDAAVRHRLETPTGQIEAFLNGYLVINVMTYGAIVLAWYALQVHRRLIIREREVLSQRARAAALEARMHEAQLDALRMELNPHFLYNALNAIAGLVRRHETGQAVGMLASLGTLLRLTLERREGHEISLRRELDLLELYLDIERTRFSDRLGVEVAVEPETSDALVPSFVLQPLVENAIRHGIALVPGPGRIRISARAEAERLVVEVMDTGPGFAGMREGVGLRNTRARLAELYGPAAELAIERVASGGTIASLRLPLRRAAQFAPSPDQGGLQRHALA